MISWPECKFDTELQIIAKQRRTKYKSLTLEKNNMRSINVQEGIERYPN